MYFLHWLLFFSLPLFISSSSSLNSLARHVIEEVSEKFYSSLAGNIVSDHEDLLSLVTFADDLEPLLASAVIDNPFVTTFELYEVILENLKLKLTEIGQWGSANGEKFYNIFFNHFSQKYAVAPSSSSSSSRIPQVPGFVGLGSFGSAFEEVGKKSFNEFSENQPLVQTTEHPDFFGAKRQKITNDDKKMWDLAISKLDFLPCKIFEFSQTIQDDTISVEFSSAANIYDNLLATFKENISKSTPYTSEAITNHFSYEILTFIDTMKGISDKKTNELFAIEIFNFVKEIVSEIGASFKEDSVEDFEEDYFTQDFKLGKRSPASSVTVSIETDHEDSEEVVEVALPSELVLPQNQAIFDNPSETIHSMSLQKVSALYKNVRGLYWGLIENDFPHMDPEVLDFLQSTIDDSIIKAYLA